jgi:uroporphyrinogen decarboxylase
MNSIDYKGGFLESERYERVMAAIRGEVPDRVPWALWGHFPSLPFLEYYSWEKANRDGEELANAHIALLNALDYKMDFLKVTPFYEYMGYRWGSKFKFVDNDESVGYVELFVKKTEDWHKLFVLDPKKELRENLRTVSILSREIGRRMPFLYTIPSPISVALHQVSTPERVYADMKSQPDTLKEGLVTIAETCIEFGRACINEGATGIFYGVGGYGGEIWGKMKRKDLAEYMLYYDKKVLEALKNAPIKVLHICAGKKGDPQRNGGLMEEGWFKQYPVDAINWWDAYFTPCSIAKRVYGDKFCLIAGIDQSSTMKHGTQKQVEQEVRAAIRASAEGGGFIIGPGCALSQDTPLANFNAVGKAVEVYGKYKLQQT